VEARVGTVEQWGAELLDAMGQVRVEVLPRPALVMMQAEESVERECFCLGEVLITECRVSVRGRRFWGRVLGDQPSRSLALAILAAAQQVLPEALDFLVERFVAERRFLDQQRQKLARAIGSTRVQFETMQLT
jgi:alpha-D-ribose 1-methylphosphonate 5-triphosphate synthase subunit PhnG